MRRILLTIVILALVTIYGGRPASAGSFTYHIVDDPNDQNGYDVNGTIVTSADTGSLRDVITSWQFTITGPGGPFVNSGTSLRGGAAEVTPTSITVPADGVFLQLGSDTGPILSWAPFEPNYTGAVGPEILWSSETGFDGDASTGPWNIATASVPEPSTMVMMGMAAVCGIVIAGARNRLGRRAESAPAA